MDSPVDGKGFLVDIPEQVLTAGKSLHVGGSDGRIQGAHRGFAVLCGGTRWKQSRLVRRPSNC